MRFRSIVGLFSTGLSFVWSARCLAIEVHVDRAASFVSLAGDGLSAETALPTIQAALERVRAEPGAHTIHVAAGEYTGPVRIDVPDLRLVGHGEVVLQSLGPGLVVEAERVRVEHIVLEGGSTRNPRLLIETGRGIVLDHITVRDPVGLGVRVRGSDTEVRIHASSLDGGVRSGLLVQGGAQVWLHNSQVTDAPGNHHTDALVMVTGEGSSLHLEHSVVLRGGRVCLLASQSAELRISGSIVAGCGANFNAQKQGYALLQDGSAVLKVEDSIIDGLGSNPHTHTARGGVDEGENVHWNQYPGFEAWESSVGILAVTVDDGRNWDNAVDLSRVMEAHDWRLTYFISKPDRRTEEEWSEIRALAARGHEIGCHSGTHPWLTLDAPLEITWSGEAAQGRVARVEIDDEARTLVITSESDGGVQTDVGPVDLRDRRTENLGRLCKAISQHPDYTCRVVKFEGRANHAGLATGLASGVTELNPGTPQLFAWDNRLSSQRGRHFFNEMVWPARFIEAQLGEGYRVRSFAYPGQKHSETVRAAVRDAGYDIARGNGNYLGSNQVMQGTIDIFQTPVSLTVDQAKGPDYAALDVISKEARIRTFGQSWATHAMASQAMGALTIHDVDTFSPQELEWLTDELSQTPVKIMTVAEIYDFLTARGMDEGGGLWTLHGELDPGLELASGSSAIDIGHQADRTADMLGRPIYGSPDLGPLEYQPSLEVGTDAFPVGVTSRIYADGLHRGLGRVRATAEASGLTLKTDGGFARFGPQEPRPAVADLTVQSWDTDSRRWSIQSAPQPLCVVVDGLGANQPYAMRWTRAETGDQAASLTSDSSGQLSFVSPVSMGSVDFVLETGLAPEPATASDSLQACLPEPIASR